MRTVKRESVKLNKCKWEALVAITREYAEDKQLHLEYYQLGIRYAESAGYRERRNDLKSSEYHKMVKIPVHMSDLALKDAYETEEKYWARIAEGINVTRRVWTETQKEYGRWLLFNPQRFSELMLGRGQLSASNSLTVAERKQVQSHIRRKARERMKSRPRVRIARSFGLDNTLYTVVDMINGQGISISSQERGKRIRIPLKGKSELHGNLRVVLKPETRSIEIHVSQDIPQHQNTNEEIVALDAGITEVFADDAGNFYGENLGKILKESSTKLKDKGIKRNRLHSIEKKNRVKGFSRKAKNIGKYNLGNKTLKKRKSRVRKTIENVINQSINEVIRKRRRKVIVTEKLDIRGRAPSKEISRRVSMWHRGTLKERVEFKGSVAGCDRKQVNPAYTSQVCPSCGYLNKANRNGNRFQCKKCEHAGHADVIAAINQKARMNDPQITVYTPKQTVRLILVERYEARKEH